MLHTDKFTVNNLQDTKICICFGAPQRKTLLQSCIKTAEMVSKNEMVDTSHNNSMVIETHSCFISEKKSGKIMTLFITTRPMASQATLEDKMFHIY